MSRPRRRRQQADVGETGVAPADAGSCSSICDRAPSRSRRPFCLPGFAASLIPKNSSPMRSQARGLHGGERRGGLHQGLGGAAGLEIAMKRVVASGSLQAAPRRSRIEIVHEVQARAFAEGLDARAPTPASCARSARRGSIRRCRAPQRRSRLRAAARPPWLFHRDRLSLPGTQQRQAGPRVLAQPASALRCASARRPARSWRRRGRRLSRGRLSILRKGIRHITGCGRSPRQRASATASPASSPCARPTTTVSLRCRADASPRAWHPRASRRRSAHCAARGNRCRACRAGSARSDPRSCPRYRRRARRSP